MIQAVSRITPVDTRKSHQFHANNESRTGLDGIFLYLLT